VRRQAATFSCVAVVSSSVTELYPDVVDACEEEDGWKKLPGATRHKTMRRRS
jgi:hypothetical protein